MVDHAQGWQAPNRACVGVWTVRHMAAGPPVSDRGPRRGARVSRRYFAATLVAFTQLMSYCDTAAVLCEFAADELPVCPA